VPSVKITAFPSVFDGRECHKILIKNIILVYFGFSPGTTDASDHFDSRLCATAHLRADYLALSIRRSVRGVLGRPIGGCSRPISVGAMSEADLADEKMTGLVGRASAQ
jgi:hypothetical protein